MAPTDEANDPRVGTVVDEYRITRLLGAGGMGRVYEAEHVGFGERVALKFIIPEYASNREAVRRFQHEARSAGHLEQANIRAVMEVGTTPDGAPYLVMELLAGRDCGRLLASRGPLAIERACNIVYQACLGLSVAHQAGIVHRDIKPQNLFVTQASDGSDLVKILDFGVTKLRIPAANLAVAAGVTVDTFHYLAPEQVRDSGKVDGRADVWAIGVVLYELLTGRRPFEGSDTMSIAHQIAFEPPESPSELRPDLPTGLISALDLALEKDPEKRFDNVLAMADAIAPFTGRPVTRRSRLASSQRPPSPTPVDAAYDSGPSTAPGVTSARPMRKVATRERLQRVYSLLILAAVVGFAGGWLTREVVGKTRDNADVSTEYPVAQAPGAASVSSPAQSSSNAAAATAASDPPPVTRDAIALVASAPATATASVQAQPATSARLRLVRVSADAGTLQAVVEIPSESPTVSSSTLRNTRTSAPVAKASAQTVPPNERVSDKPRVDDHAQVSADSDNPL